MICLLPYPGNAWGEYLIVRQPGWGWGQSWALNPAALELMCCKSTSLTLVFPKECSAIWTDVYWIEPQVFEHGSCYFRDHKFHALICCAKLLFLDCSSLYLNAQDQRQWFLCCLGGVHVVAPRFCRHNQGVLGELCATKPMKDSILLCHCCWAEGWGKALLHQRLVRGLKIAAPNLPLFVAWCNSLWISSSQGLFPSIFSPLWDERRGPTLEK